MADVVAHRVEDFDHCENDGDFFITPPGENGVRRLSFLCPCGCGSLCGIRVRTDGKNIDGAWGWNLDEEKPTVTPSININFGHWHGYLTDGVFKSV